MSQKKLTPQSGQKGLKLYLQPKVKLGLGHPLSTSTPKQDTASVKKRTPPKYRKPIKKEKNEQFIIIINLRRGTFQFNTC